MKTRRTGVTVSDEGSMNYAQLCIEEYRCIHQGTAVNTGVFTKVQLCIDEYRCIHQGTAVHNQ